MGDLSRLSRHDEIIHQGAFATRSVQQERFGLIDFLTSQRQGDKGIAALAGQLRQKTPPDKAIQSVYGLDRKALLSAWANYAAKRYPVAKKR